MSKKLLNLCMVALMSVVSTAAWALSEVGGVYQIGTAEDFNAFATLVNGGEVYARAELTADIDLGTNVTMVGTADSEGNRYDGTFDGKGHTIKYSLTASANEAGLFRYLGWRGIIQNLKVEGVINTEYKFAAGIAGKGRGIVRDCYVDITINSTRTGSDKDATHGGVVGVGYSGTIVENTLAKVAIVGSDTQNCGGVVGWAENPCNIVNCLVVSDGSSFDTSNGGSRNIARNDSRVKAVNVETYNQNIYGNRPGGACYNNYVTNQWGNNEATTVVPLADLADGKICYQLNNDQSRIAWVQTIGTDPFPVPAPFGSGQVYASAATNCNGQAEGLTYSNDGTAQATAHQFDMYGICSVCGTFNFNYLDFDNPERFEQTSRSFLLNNKADIDIAEGLNRICNGFKLHMKMNADISYTADPGKYLFNTNDWIEGDFNGGGHALTIEMSEMGDRASLFPVRHNGSVEDLILHGNIKTSGQYWGSISNDSYERLVRNVYSDINFTSTRVGDNTAGGFFGMVRTEKKVENCVYAGNITLPGAEGGARCARVGGFAGWSHAKTYYINCAVLGNINGAGNQTLDNDTENSQNIARNPNNVVATNVYVANPITGNSVSDHDKYTHYTNTEGIANGELAFLLNGGQSGVERFYQLIGTDPEPMPIVKEGALVYALGTSYRCDGKPLGDDVTYGNSEPSGIPDHQFVDGFCSVCGIPETDEDGYLKIVNPQSLVKFSELVNAGQTDLKARMYADIDMNGVTYTTAGSQANIFVGEFDGQGHHINNLTVSGGDYTGLIGVIGGGAIVKNFVLDANCSISGNAFVGAIGGTNGGGHVYISNIGNEGNVTGTAQNASGILGVDMGGNATLHISNCYVTGAISGARESATICSWSNASSVVENCYSTATLAGIYGTNSFTRGDTKIVNCYEIESVGQQSGVNKVTAEEVANGALCFNLGEPFGQEIGVNDHPIFGGLKVYCLGGSYYTNEDLSALNIEVAQGNDDCILPAKKYGGAYDAYTYVAQGDFEFGDWNTNNPNYNVIIGIPAEQGGKAWFTPGYNVTGWNYGQDLPEFGNGKPADVYALRFFTVEGEIPSTLYMPAPHDDAPCEYYINGVQVFAETDGWYEDEVVRLTDEQKALIKADGSTINVFAFHVHQNWGGRYADGGLYTAGSPVDAFIWDNNKRAIDATIAIMEAQGIGAEEIEYASNINYRNGFAKGLAQLRKARRLAFDARTENFTGSAPADGMIAYILNVGAKMFLAGGNDWGTHASLNHMGAKCVLHANSSGENRYTIQTNLPNGVRGKDDALGHNGYVDATNWNTTGANWAWEIEAAEDGTYHIINAENNLYLGMTDDERLQVDTDKTGADNEFNKWIFVTPEEFIALAENATPEAPVDLGHLVHQATFAENDFEGDNKAATNGDMNDSKWQHNAGGIWEWNSGNKDNRADHSFEMWNTKDKGYVYLVQEVEGLPAGKYTVKMNGFYRDGRFESADEGNVRQLAYMFAGSEKNCVPMASIVDGSGNCPGYGRGGSSGIVIPDGCNDAARFFQVGTYVNTIDAMVGPDGKLKIGLFRGAEDVLGEDWIVTDNWRLYYQGRSIDVTISEAGYATFVAPWNINTFPADIEVSAAQVNKNKEGYVHLEPVTAIPAGEAVVLSGGKGTYTFVGTSEAAELGADNDLIAATAEVEADGTQYILAVVDEEVGFAKATPATKIAVGKGYLIITGSGVKPFYPFGDGATGIKDINDVNGNILIYNVAGQRLGKTQKGINIINGKKVLK